MSRPDDPREKNALNQRKALNPNAFKPPSEPSLASGYQAIALGTAWIAGLAAAGLFSAGLIAIFPTAALALLLLAILSSLLRRPLRAPPKSASLLSALTLAFFLGAAFLAGAWRLGAASPTPSATCLSDLVGQQLIARGTLLQTPLARGSGYELRLAAREIVLLPQRPKNVGDASPSTDQPLAQAPACPEFVSLLVKVAPYSNIMLPADLRTGDSLEVSAGIEPLSSWDMRAWKAASLASDYPLATLEATAVKSLDPDLAYPKSLTTAAFARLEAYRELALRYLRRYVAEPEGALAQGIVFGERAELPQALVEDFARTSLTHVVAVSGMNVALVVAFVAPLARLVPGRIVGLLLTVLSIGLYSILCGFSPSVVRAALMGGLTVWGRTIGRPADALNGLAISAFAMTAWRPDWLFDLGFQLSFLATLGLVSVAPSLESLLDRGPLRKVPVALRSALALTLAAWVVTTPLLMISFGRVSLIGPIANLLGAMSVAPAMLLSSLAVGLGLVWEPLGVPFALATWVVLSYLVSVVELLAPLPWASLPLGEVDPPLVIALYLLIGGLFFFGRRGLFPDLSGAMTRLFRRDERRGQSGMIPIRILGSVAFLAIFAWAGAQSSRVDSSRLTMLDVGQGDALLIQTPGGKNVLIDGGPDPKTLVARLDRRLPFWSRRLDLVVLTHEHDDHLAGLLGLFDRFEMGETLELRPTEASPPAPDNPLARPATTRSQEVVASANYRRWEEQLARYSVPRSYAQSGQALDLGDGLTLRVLREGDLGKGAFGSANDVENERSLVLALDWPGGRALLLSDAGRPAQRALLESSEEVGGAGVTPLGRLALIKAPHHGARDSLDAELLAQTRPSLALISVGERNRYGHPATETLELLRESGVGNTLRTDLDGTIAVDLRPGELEVRLRER